MIWKLVRNDKKISIRRGGMNFNDIFKIILHNDNTSQLDLQIPKTDDICLDVLLQDKSIDINIIRMRD